MIIDDQLELLPWEAHVGADIGSVSPVTYGWRLTPENVVEFYTTAPSYADWLAAVHRPICPNTGKLTLEFDLATDSFAVTAAQALEFDTRVSIAGMNYNLSSQFNYNKNGVFQISNQAGSWIDTAWIPGKFNPYQWYTIVYSYSFDTVAKTSSFLSASLDGKVFVVAAALQNVPATNLGWADSCSLQVQQDLAAGGGHFAMWLRNIRYIWS